MRKLRLKTIIALIAIAAFSVGCSSDKGSNRANFGFGPGGFGFGFGGAAVARAVGNDTAGRLQLGLEFGLVSGGVIGQSSPVQAGGEMHILQPLACNNGQFYGQVGLAPGVWQVRTVQPGYISSGGALNQLVLEAQGPSGIATLTVSGMIFSMTPKWFTCSGAGGFDELAAMVQIVQVNGAACNASLSIDLMANPYMCGGF